MYSDFHQTDPKERGEHPDYIYMGEKKCCGRSQWSNPSNILTQLLQVVLEHRRRIPKQKKKKIDED